MMQSILSSRESLATYREQLNSVRDQLADLAGASEVIDKVEAEARQSSANPLPVNRLKPWVVSQQTNVRIETVHEVLKALLKNHAIEAWVLVKCPTEHEPLFSTSDHEIFNKKIDDPCKYCGDIHEDQFEFEYEYKITLPTFTDVCRQKSCLTSFLQWFGWGTNARKSKARS